MERPVLWTNNMIPTFTSLSAALLALAALLSTSQSAHAEDCQARLDEAVTRMTTSGPVRVSMTRDTTRDGLTFRETLTYVEPRRFRVTVEDIYSGAAAEAAIRQNGKSSVLKDTIIIGNTVHLKTPTTDGEWIKGDDAKSAEGFADIALLITRPDHFYATSCDGQTIEYIYNGLFSASKFKSFAARDAARRKSDKDLASRGQPPESIPGRMELDPKTDRARTLRQGDYYDLSPRQRQMTIVFDYDASIVVDAPPDTP
jgi:hypothetical protein